MNNDEMYQLVFETPAQLETAHGLEVPTLPPAEHIVLVGMGGSAMAAHAATVAVSSSDAVVAVHQGYGLPDWAIARGATVVACSYSGNTEETADAVELATHAGLPVAVVTSGGRLLEWDGSAATVAIHPGLQPRAAIGLQTAAVIRILAALGVADGWERAVDETAAILRVVLGNGDGAAVELGRDLADGMRNATPLVVGGRGVAALAARRWVTQINENAKRAAFAAELPEMNHNLLEALASAVVEPGRLGVVAMVDPEGHPRHQVRLEHTMSRLGQKVQSIGEVRAQGQYPLARLFSLVIVGDVASVALADLLEIEAMSVDVLEDFKRAIALREDQT